jgi:hypothetical protein
MDVAGLGFAVGGFKFGGGGSVRSYPTEKQKG